jgi:6-phospho-3-hexuloisomerase
MKTCSLEYINKIGKNVLNVQSEQLQPLFESLKVADCIVCGGSGRSLYSLNTAISQIAKIKEPKVVISPDDAGFPGRNLFSAAYELERRYNNIILLINSGSGETGDPKILAEDLGQYIAKTGSKKFFMGLITSNPYSSIAKTVEKQGCTVRVEGRKKGATLEEYSETGIMGDMFELSSLYLIQAMCEVINLNKGIDKVFDLLEQEFPLIGEIIDSNIDTKAYLSVLDLLERRSDLFIGGKGTANEVAKMTAIRLFHIKKPLGDNVYIARGVNTPRPRAGDLEILISYSGETKSILRWCKTFRNLGGTVLAIIGTKDSTLEKMSDYSIIMEEEVMKGQPRRFYARAAYVLSPLPVLLTQRLGERGFKLPEYVLNWYHSIIQ